MVYGADGSGKTRLTDGGGSSSFNPDWQPFNRPPDCSRVGARASSLWPPNHKLATVSLTGATDLDGDAVTITVTGVTGDETADGDFTFGPAANQVRLRAERDGRADGRIYSIAFQSSDNRGGKCDGTAAVAVRHDR